MSISEVLLVKDPRVLDFLTLKILLLAAVEMDLMFTTLRYVIKSTTI